MKVLIIAGAAASPAVTVLDECKYGLRIISIFEE